MEKPRHLPSGQTGRRDLTADAVKEHPANAIEVPHSPGIDASEELKKEKSDSHKRLNLGVGEANQILTHLGGVGSRTPVPLNYAETYLFVAKIAASATGPDQVFIRVYGPQESVERDEPGSWTAPIFPDLARGISP